MLRGGVGAAASHRSAGVLWNFDGVSGFPVDVIVAFGSSYNRAPAIRSRSLEPSDVVRLGGLTVTSRARTLCDLGRFEADAVVEQAVESALRSRDRRQPDQWDAELLADLERRVALHPRVRGTSTLRRVLAGRGSRGRPTGSFAETVAVQALVRAGIPVICQPTVTITRRGTYFPDIAVPDRGLLIEIDGRAGHEGELARERDLPRQNQLLRGFALMRFTGAYALHDTNSMVAEVAELVAGLPRRSTHWESGSTRVERTAVGWTVTS